MATGLLVVLAALAAFGLHRSRAWRAPRRDNLLLITLDTTRADRIGCYGYAQARTPNLDRLAREGVRFQYAYGPAPLTLPSHASILTGLLPPEHGVRNNGTFFLKEQFETVATLLKKRGYRTAAFVSAFVLDSRFGLNRGFDVYDEHVEENLPEGMSLEAQRSGDKTVASLKSWIRTEAAQAGAPFFAWLHLYDAHEPHRPPPPFADAFPGSPYDGEIAFDDSLVGMAMEALSQAGLRERTLVAVIGDHGESLGEHGEVAHSVFVYEGAIRVPFVLWGPGHVPSGAVVRLPVRATDVAPTLLDLLGAPELRVAHGRSLVPLMEGRDTAPAPAVYAETLLPQLDFGWAPLRSVRDERFKLIDAPRPELYDLRDDPHEGRNLYASEPQKAAALRRELERLTGGAWGVMAKGEIDAETKEKLAALGYLGGAGDADAAPSVDGRKDPKDGIVAFNVIRRATEAIRARSFEEARGLIDEARQADRDNPIISLLDASALLGLGEHRSALQSLQRFLVLKPGSAEAHYLAAVCHLRLGNNEAAFRETELTLVLSPHHADAHVLRSRLHIATGSVGAAITELRTALDRKPKSVAVRVILAKALADAGRTGEARTEFEEVLRLQADNAAALAGLGLLLGARSEAEPALRLLTRALEVDPEQERARFALAQIYDNLGRRDEAATEFARVVDSLHRKLEAEPGDADARLNLARVLERQGRKPEAEAEYRRLAAMTSASAQAKAIARNRLAAAGR